MRQISYILLFSKKNKDALQMHNTCFQSERFQPYMINALRFLSIENANEFCQFLGTSSISGIEDIMNFPEYECYTISKKRGGKRLIFSPKMRVKWIQKRLNYYLQAYYLWIKPKEVYGFVINPQHSYKEKYHIVTNAQAHVGKKHLLNMDLRDFFPSISAKRIKGLFLSPIFKFDEQMAIALTFLTTYRGKLPTGAPTSPVLSNFICLELDAALQSFCHGNNLQYTRYADDLTFSSNEFISNDITLKIKEIISNNGFEVNKKKVHLKSSHQKQIVTGLVVNEKVNIDRKLLKKIRAMLHDLEKNGVETATMRHFKMMDPADEKMRQRFICRLKGYLSFMKQARGSDDVVYQKLSNKLTQVLQ